MSAKHWDWTADPLTQDSKTVPFPSCFAPLSITIYSSFTYPKSLPFEKCCSRCSLLTKSWQVPYPSALITCMKSTRFFPFSEGPLICLFQRIYRFDCQFQETNNFLFLEKTITLNILLHPQLQCQLQANGFFFLKKKDQSLVSTLHYLCFVSPKLRNYDNALV
ncbi:hypothetical protein QQP08_023345 [Theobroma cacao]|nr:hypothetical protein QQP08_023345 [Theobroma cacao]